MYMEITLLGNKLRIDVCIICIFLGIVIGATTICSCAGGLVEGFDATKSILGSVLSYNIGDGVPGSISNVSPPKSYDSYFEKLNDQTPELQETGDVNEMNIFADNKASPDCCPSTYSTSSGCLCVSSNQMKFIDQRGGNRTENSLY